MDAPLTTRADAFTPVTIEIPLAWGEMDALGHVNNVVYFRYLESSRVAYIDRLNWGRGTLAAEGVGFILQSVQARFRRPLVYPDTVRVTARLAELESDRFTLEHEVISTALGDVAALGRGTIVTYDYGKQSKAPMPDRLRQAILTLEQPA